jgi:predicted lipid-binding transport protein (Tim44 family)
MIALMVVAGIFLVRFLMRRFMPNAAGAGNGAQLAAATAGAARTPPAQPTSFPDERPAHLRNILSGNDGAATPQRPRRNLGAPAASMAVAAPANIPAGFDAAGFERIAKMIFIRMQAANDSGDLNDLRAFTTPEMFAAIKLDLQDRGDATQRTDVVRVDAEVLDVAEEADRQIVSVRFHGLIREELEGRRRAVSTRSGI